MDSKNGGFDVEEDSGDFEFTTISSMGTSNKEIMEKMQKLEAELLAIKNKVNEAANKENSGSLLNDGKHEIDPIRHIGVGNKWNVRDAGQNLAFRENALTVLYTSSSADWNWNTVRAKMPIPKGDLNRKSVSGYYELEIIKHQQGYCCFQIGFCDGQFPLDGAKKCVGELKHSIGIKDEKTIKVNGSAPIGLFNDKAVNKFYNVDNIIGCGLLYSPEDPSLKCFATLNGTMMGSVDLPLYFADIDLFPAVSLDDSGVSIKANFGQKSWRFDPTKLLEG